jgi:hypothetical protein
MRNMVDAERVDIDVRFLTANERTLLVSPAPRTAAKRPGSGSGSTQTRNAPGTGASGVRAAPSEFT